VEVIDCSIQSLYAMYLNLNTNAVDKIACGCVMKNKEFIGLMLYVRGTHVDNNV